MTPSPPVFGRATPRPQGPPPIPAKRRAAGPQPTAAWQDPVDGDAAAELAAWRRTRRRYFPLRQVSLILGLCFAAASFVLPDQINDAAAYVLYALAGISFLTGLRQRRKNPS